MSGQSCAQVSIFLLKRKLSSNFAEKGGVVVLDEAVGNFRRTRFHGLERTQLAGYLVGAAYYLLCIARLLVA